MVVIHDIISFDLFRTNLSYLSYLSSFGFPFCYTLCFSLTIYVLVFCFRCIIRSNYVSLCFMSDWYFPSNIIFKLTFGTEITTTICFGSMTSCSAAFFFLSYYTVDTFDSLNGHLDISSSKTIDTRQMIKMIKHLRVIKQQHMKPVHCLFFIPLVIHQFNSSS